MLWLAVLVRGLALTRASRCRYLDFDLKRVGESWQPAAMCILRSGHDGGHVYEY